MSEYPELDAIEARANAATEGPWVLFERDPEGDEITTVCCPCADHKVAEPGDDPHPQAPHCAKCVLWSVVDGADGALRHGSGAFIATARTDVPRLAKALRRALAEMEKVCFCAWHDLIRANGGNPVSPCSYCRARAAVLSELSNGALEGDREGALGGLKKS